MAVNFPTSIDSFVQPSASNPTNAPSHAGQHDDENTAIIALETKVGANGSAVTTTHDYKLSGVTAADKAASLVGAEVLQNKTFSTGVKLDANADQNITQHGMARQAIMNGNFDVWQRGASVALADVTTAFQADRWFDYVDKNGGTLPTLTRSRGEFTPGELPGAKYFTRLTTNGAGTSLGVSSYAVYLEKIENGVSKLCGLNKKVTVSFWARSSIANKRICPTLVMDYGSGGSPTGQEKILGTPITLTSILTKYTATFTTNTLVGKTFGTNGDDNLQVNFWSMWGTTKGNTDVQASVTAETFGGAGTLDIAMVGHNNGDAALPFQPKSFEEELRACQRYYEIGNSWSGFCGNVTSGSTYHGLVGFKTQKRTSTPTVSWISNETVNLFPNTATTTTNVSATGFTGFAIANSTGSGGYFFFYWKAENEL